MAAPQRLIIHQQRQLFALKWHAVQAAQTGRRVLLLVWSTVWQNDSLRQAQMVPFMYIQKFLQFSFVHRSENLRRGNGMAFCTATGGAALKWLKPERSVLTVQVRSPPPPQPHKGILKSAAEGKSFRVSPPVQRRLFEGQKYRAVFQQWQTQTLSFQQSSAKSILKRTPGGKVAWRPANKGKQLIC